MSYILDLTNVGKTKMIGYLPLITIENEGYAVRDLLQYARDSKLESFYFKEGEVPIFSGALYFADIQKIEKFINFPEFDEIFEDGYLDIGLKIERSPYAVLEIVFNEHVCENNYQLFYDLIALMFNDPLSKYQKRNAIKEVEALIQESKKIKF